MSVTFRRRVLASILSRGCQAAAPHASARTISCLTNPELAARAQSVGTQQHVWRWGWTLDAASQPPAPAAHSHNGWLVSVPSTRAPGPPPAARRHYNKLAQTRYSEWQEASPQPPRSDDAVVVAQPGAKALNPQYLRSARNEFTIAEPTNLLVKAYHLGGELDLAAITNSFNDRHQGHVVHGRDHRILFIPHSPDATSDASLVRQRVVVYRFGSIIFFGSHPTDDSYWISHFRRYVKSPVEEPCQDETTLIVRPSLESWFAKEPDTIIVQLLDIDNMRIISKIMGQSVALDYYNRIVDKGIQAFNVILKEIAETGNSSRVKSIDLLRSIARNSLLHTEVVSSTGLLDIQETAWRKDTYYDIWHTLREDYELMRRLTRST